MCNKGPNVLETVIICEFPTVCLCVRTASLCVFAPSFTFLIYPARPLLHMGSHQMSSGQSGTHVSWYWPWGPSANKATKFSHRSKPWFYMWETVVYIFFSGKRFYVRMHLSGCSTCRKIWHYICIYLKGHTWSLKCINVLIPRKIAPQMFFFVVVFLQLKESHTGLIFYIYIYIYIQFSLLFICNF